MEIATTEKILDPFVDKKLDDNNTSTEYDLFGTEIPKGLAYRLVYRKRYPDIIQYYDLHESSFWTVNEIDFSSDRQHFETRLTKDEQHFILYVLAFFAASDGIVAENIIERFCQEIPIPDVRHFYGFQYAMENIHSKTYTLLLESIVKNEEEREYLFQSIDQIKSIREKGLWSLKWIEDDKASLAKRLFAYALIEGVFFSASFCAIFWIKKRGIMPGLSFSNELISRDENLHAGFSCLMYNKLTKAHPEQRLSTEEIYQITKEAVDIERLFVADCLPSGLIGMNIQLMSQHIEKCADIILEQVNYPKLFNSESPFDFMDMCGIQGKTNFFERRVSEYSRNQINPSAVTNKVNLINFDEMEFESCK